MIINWFSPLPPARTGIADYTLILLPELAKHGQVQCWTDQPQWDPIVEQYATIHRMQAEDPWPLINKADITFYNLGNNMEFHAQIYTASILHPGIVILHDLRLHHFFCGFYQASNIKHYISVMARVYDAAQEAQLMLAGSCSILDLAQRYPLVEPAVEQALGAVVHTAEAFDYLKTRDYSVFSLPLPYTSSVPPRNSTAKSGSYSLIVFGHIGSNRGLDLILSALRHLNENERQQLHLNVYGNILDKSYIESLIVKLSLSDMVTLHGYISEERLQIALSEADLAINLRRPTMGEASLTQLQIWANSLPSLVSNDGWYASLPKLAVKHIDLGKECEQIVACLVDFLSDPKAYRDMGAYAYQYLAQHHTTENYVKYLLKFAQSRPKHLSVLSMERFAGKVASNIADISDEHGARLMINSSAKILGQWLGGG